MPRRKSEFNDKRSSANTALVDRLVEELRHSRDFGQPVIEEQSFPTGNIRATVIWDVWDRLPHEDRTEIILRAYELAEGKTYRDRIALASGLTAPEAYEAGMLPYEVRPLLRRNDPVTEDECRRAMIAAGASILNGEDCPTLRFSSRDEAQAAKDRLIATLPLSDEVWVIRLDESRAADWFFGNQSSEVS